MKYDCVLTIRCTSEDKLVLAEDATKAGYCVSDYIRYMLGFPSTYPVKKKLKCSK